MSISDPLRLVVFDCDGTLVDSQHSIIDCMTSAFEEHGLTAPLADDVRSIVGLSLDEAISRLTPDLTPEAIDVLVENYKLAFQRSRRLGEHDEPLYPGTIEVLRELEDAGYLLGVATGKSMRGLKATLGRHGLIDRFQTLQTADIAPGKPHPGRVVASGDNGGPEGNAVDPVG